MLGGCGGGRIAKEEIHDILKAGVDFEGWPDDGFKELVSPPDAVIPVRVVVDGLVHHFPDFGKASVVKIVPGRGNAGEFRGFLPPFGDEPAHRGILPDGVSSIGEIERWLNHLRPPLLQFLLHHGVTR